VSSPACRRASSSSGQFAEASKSFKLGGVAYPVYKLEAVPVRLLRDLFDRWPDKAGKLPKDFSSFQYALRKSKQGNHPWILQFSERPPLALSYGRGGLRVKLLDEEAEPA
jgi:hypothetical protein